VTIGERTRRAEFGDFQTPPELARAVVGALVGSGLRPASVLEPTCGTGSLLHASLEAFSSVERALGVELDPEHLLAARTSLRALGEATACELRQADFFTFDWERETAALPEPLLVIGNPPWVTNAALGRLGSDNLPPKANTAQRAGLEALTGRSNFDISEWMLLRCLALLAGRHGTLAMLCKTQAARRVLERLWSEGAAIATADLYRIDAARHFGAAVDACLLVVSSSDAEPAAECRVHSALDAPALSRFGLRSGKLVADLAAHRRWAHLAGESPAPWRWRSGIKHDCARVMELRETPDGLVNGLGETVELEPELLYPLVKSAQLGGDRSRQDGEQRWLLVPQRTTGEDTAPLAERAPLAWAYLCRHGARLDARRSSIYRRRPRFSIFGVGPYSFAPWKVAISGLYKRLSFRVLGPLAGRPQVLDDTGYSLPCRSEPEARRWLRLLESIPAREFFEARVFWDAKRPITAGLLNQLDLAKLAAEPDGARQSPRSSSVPNIAK
jgi:hypothetical protein